MLNGQNNVEEGAFKGEKVKRWLRPTDERAG